MELFFENQGLCHIGEKILHNLDFKSQMDCRSVTKSWKAIVDKIHQNVHNNFLKNHFSQLDKDKKINRKMWSKFAKMIRKEAPFIAKCYLLHFILKHHGKLFEMPLITFLKVGNLRMVAFILKNSLFWMNNWTLELKKATDIGLAEVVKCLITYTPFQMYSSVRPIFYENLMFLAAENGHLEVMKIFFQKLNPHFAYAVFGQGHCRYHTILHIASEKGHTEIMQYFVNMFGNDKTKLNVKDEKGGCFAITPIELAVIDNQLGVVKILCDALDFNMREKTNLVSKAVSSGNAKIIDYLLDKFEMRHILTSCKSSLK